MNNKLVDVYGRGWAFPLIFTDDGVAMAQGEEDVRQSIKILFSTQPGERIMRNDYGCDLNQYMFNNITNQLLSDIERQIYQSVLRYEPRANITNIEFDNSSMNYGILNVVINYCLRGNDQKRQFSTQLDIVNGSGAY
ncbi:TPA: GPW/gp25 family protein [Aeromonas sobria]|nr:GPW/gp25 family protein [Aeromonas sobria]